MSMYEAASANKPRILTGAIALTRSDEFYQGEVAKQAESSAISGMQLGLGKSGRNLRSKGWEEWLWSINLSLTDWDEKVVQWYTNHLQLVSN